MLAANVPAVITSAVVLPVITPTASAPQSALPEPTAGQAAVANLLSSPAAPGASLSPVPGLLSVDLGVQVNLGLGGTTASTSLNVGGVSGPATAGTSSASPLELGATLDVLGLSAVVQTQANLGGGGTTTAVPSAPAASGGGTVSISLGGGAATTSGQGVSVDLTLGNGGLTAGVLNGSGPPGSGTPSPIANGTGAGGAVAPESANAADGGPGAPGALGVVETGTDGPADAELAAIEIVLTPGAVVGAPTAASATLAKASSPGNTAVEAVAGAHAEVVPQPENVELPAATSSVAQDEALAVPAGASAEVPGSLLAELWSGDVEALERSLRQFMERVDDLGEDLSAWISQAHLLDLLLAAGATAAAAEIMRRRVRRNALRAQQTGERGWSPALPGPLYQLGV